MNKKLISWDFDGTLVDDFYGEVNTQKEEIQKICRDLIDNGHDTYIVTKRFGEEYKKFGKGNEHLEVYELAQKLGIPKSKVHFTNRDMKAHTLKKLGINVHFENSEVEVDYIRKTIPEIIVIHVEDPYWKDLRY